MSREKQEIEWVAAAAGAGVILCGATDHHIPAGRSIIARLDQPAS